MKPTNYASTLPAEWTGETADAYARILSPDNRELLLEALQSAVDIDNAGQLLTVIRDFLGADEPNVAGLAFEAWDYEEHGHYLNEDAHVFYRDGRDPQKVELPGRANDLLTELYGKVGPRAWLAIIPATGESELIDAAEDIKAAAEWIADQNSGWTASRGSQPNPQPL